MSVDLKTAYKLAEQECAKSGAYKLIEAVDIGDRYAFCFEPADGSDPIPGDCPITVHKETGEVGLLPIPPLENLDLLEEGKAVEI